MDAMQKGLPYMMNPASGAPQQDDGNVVKEYVDPMRVYKPIEKINVKNDDVNDRMNLKGQYQK